MRQELNAWGHPGRGQNALIIKSDGELAIVAVREALARCHGGRVTPEQPPCGEHQANGLPEVTGRHVRGHARVLQLPLQNQIWQYVFGISANHAMTL
ncbi:hypothetical protein N9L68_06020 [bacterium]|nr:hypothetical protein [bacterium]